MNTKAKTASLFLSVFSSAFLSTVYWGDSDLRMSVSAESKKNLATVLPAENFFGNAKLGYLAAKRVPDICEKLFCYCGCDLTDNHSSLLDCFTSDHGVDCNICQEEAILADKMHMTGSSLADIQKFIDQKYSPEYNSIFAKPSKKLLEYRTNRKWKPTAADLANESGSSLKSSECDLSRGSEKVGSCCGTDDHTVTKDTPVKQLGN